MRKCHRVAPCDSIMGQSHDSKVGSRGIELPISKPEVLSKFVNSIKCSFRYFIGFWPWW